jgi:transcriptional regulator with XRE-family HTH domain
LRAETVRSIRGILGRTQAELAGVLGVSAKAVHCYEQGRRAVPARDDPAAG